MFPLRCTVLLPHTLQPLRIFERQYRQMVDDVLDGPGLIAMACLAGEKDSTGDADLAKGETNLDDSGQIDVNGDGGELPQLRPAVCVGHIVEHERVAGGQHIILLQGVCRATIAAMREPNGDRLYRMAMLRPVEDADPDDAGLEQIRRTLDNVLRTDRLMRMRKVQQLVEWLDKNNVPTVALLEMLGMHLVQDDELRYRLLAEPDVQARSGYVLEELRDLFQMIGQAELQSFAEWPKGMSWN